MVVVTGAAGHVGNNLVRLLVDRGERVRALAMPGEDTACLDGMEVEIVRGDVLDPQCLPALVEGARVVYHLAGIIAIRPGAEELMRNVNVQGTRNVAAACRVAGVGRLVYVSSIHALGRPPDGVTIDEGVGFDPDNPAGIYDQTKAQASLAVLEEVGRGLDAVLICPTGIVGPNDVRVSEVGHLLRRWMRPRPHFVVKGAFDWVDVRDVAGGMILAAERGRTGETYILSGNRVTIRDLYRVVRRAAGHRAPGLQLPFRLALRAVPFTLGLAKLLGRRAQYTAYSLETVASNSVISRAKAVRELGYDPRPVEQTIVDTVAWWKQAPARAAARSPAVAPTRVPTRTRTHAPHRASSRRREAGVAVVTGASSGIGAVVASELASVGYHVVLTGRRLARLADVVRGIVDRGGRAEAVTADLAETGGARELYETVTRRHGGADVLVNNAGFGWYGFYADMSWETAAQMIQVNATSVANLVSLFLPGMRERRRGHILNLSSVAGSLPSQGIAVYAATKSFVDSFSTSLYRELKGSGVHVTSVRPGPVLTEFYRTALRLPGGRAVPAERFAVSPLVVARAVVRLLRHPKRVSFVPAALGITPWIESGFGWFIDRLGPMLLRKRPAAT